MTPSQQIIFDELKKTYFLAGYKMPSQQELEARAFAMAEEIKFSSEHLSRCFELARRNKPFPIVADLYKAFREEILPNLDRGTAKPMIAPPAHSRASGAKCFRASCVRFGFVLPDFTPEEKAEAKKCYEEVEKHRRILHPADFARWQDSWRIEGLDERARRVSDGGANVVNLFGGR